MREITKKLRRMQEKIDLDFLRTPVFDISEFSWWNM
jgi:hypothetical protein